MRRKSLILGFIGIWLWCTLLVSPSPTLTTKTLKGLLVSVSVCGFTFTLHLARLVAYCWVELGNKLGLLWLKQPSTSLPILISWYLGGVRPCQDGDGCYYRLWASFWLLKNLWVMSRWLCPLFVQSHNDFLSFIYRHLIPPARVKLLKYSLLCYLD